MLHGKVENWEESNSSDPLLSMQRSVRSGCHQGLSDAPEAEQDRKFALPIIHPRRLCVPLWFSVALCDPSSVLSTFHFGCVRMLP